MSAMNGLQLLITDRSIMDQGLDLTELEGSLIEKNNNIPKDIPTAKIKMDSPERQAEKHSCH